MICAHCRATIGDGARFCPACGKSATEPPAPSLVGSEIAGRYRIIAKLGEGGMGAVYRGEQLSLKRAVAVKVLKPELSTNSTLVLRFNAEAEAVAKLSHPNTVNIYDFGQGSDGALFIAMEFIEGRSLRNVIHAEGPLLPARALHIAIQVAASLTDAHAHAVVHRDLKPDNVMLQDRGRQRDVARVLDFGIAKLRDDSRATQQSMTQAGDMLGTPQYMAPEQIRGERIDGRTDVYALGCLIYEMLTARLPFEASTVMAVLSKHLLDPVMPPSQRRPDLGLPAAIDHVVLAAMAKDPNARPPTMEQYGEQLAAVLAVLPPDPNRSATPPLTAAQDVLSPPPPITPAGYQAPIAASPLTHPQATLHAGNSKVALYAVLGAVLIAVIGIGAFAARQSRPAPSKPEVVASGSATTPPTPAADATETPDPWAPGSGTEPTEPDPTELDPTPELWGGGSAVDPPVKQIERVRPGFRPGQPKPQQLSGTPVALGNVKLILPPGFTYIWQQGAVIATNPAMSVMISAGPLLIDSNDGATIARDYAARTGLVLDRVTSVVIAGSLRPAAALHGSVNNVSVAQGAFAFIGKGYRVGVSFTVPFALRNDATLLKFGDDFLAHRVILP